MGCCFFWATCQKEYSYEGGPVLTNTAYTFIGAGAACANPVLGGRYYAGTALADTNTVSLRVHVTATGPYNITTNTNNGLYFSATGSFSDTGTQTVILKGRGTPANAGSFSYGTAKDTGCSFSILVDKQPVKMAAYSISGSPNACVSLLVNGSYVYGSSLTTLNSLIANVLVTVPGYYSMGTDTLDGISFSATGTFTSPGIKSVTLAGKGIPGTPKNLLFTLLGDTSHCSFAIAVVNPQPLATYVLESGFGTPNPCIYTVAGNYHVDSLLTNANTVSLHVYVAVPGNFTITTDEVNGMVFSYTGTFSAIGSQQVTLVGSGKPTVSGGFLLTPQIVGPHPLGGETCAINIPVQ